MSMAEQVSVKRGQPRGWRPSLAKHYLAPPARRRSSFWMWRAIPLTSRLCAGASRLTPLFFGSAVTNFGVEPFLEAFLSITPPPLPRMSDIGADCARTEPYFSGFIFKIQANMNPAHRDRLAFVRVVSGEFEKGMDGVAFRHGQAGGQLKQPQQFMADEREAVEEAWAGRHHRPVLTPAFISLGDTLSNGPKTALIENIPVLAPLNSSTGCVPVDSMKRKQFQKGIQPAGGGRRYPDLPAARRPAGKNFMVGVVGVLQFEVLEHRLKTEYGVDRDASWTVHALPLRALGGQDRPRTSRTLKLTSTSGRAQRLPRRGTCCCLKTNG